MGSQMPSAVNGINGVQYAAEYPSTEAITLPYDTLPQYHSQRSRIRVASVGAGASGLCLAYKMERMLRPGTWELVLYEKNPHFGGTWYENT
jgi:ribulose 1,5-bisphosphate synthetase/thiazole synthase